MSTDSKAMLLDIPTQINKLGNTVYQASLNQSNPKVWECVRAQCRVVNVLLNPFVNGAAAWHEFNPSDLQDHFKPFLSEYVPGFDQIRRHLVASSFLRLVEDLWFEAQAVLLFKTPEEQMKGIRSIRTKIIRFENGAHHRLGLAERIQESRCDIRKQLVAMPNTMLEIARLIRCTGDKENKMVWHEIGVKIQDVMGMATYLKTSSTQLTFSTQNIDGIEKPKADSFDSEHVKESSFILTVLQDAWQTAKELLILSPHKQREALSRIYNRMDRIFATILHLFNQAAALKRAGEMHAATLVEREERRKADGGAPETKKRKSAEPEPNAFFSDDISIINRCHAFLQHTGIWRIGQQAGSVRELVPPLNYTLLEAVLAAVHVRMRVTCARMNPSECADLVNPGLALLFPGTKPETIGQVSQAEWDRLDSDVNALCLRAM